MDAQKTTLPATEGPWLHLALQGRVYVRTDAGEDVLTLECGDLLLLTQGQSHWLSTHPRAGVFCGSRVETALPESSAPNSGLKSDSAQDAAQSELLCSRIHYHQGEQRTVFDFLPPTLLVRRGELRGSEWIVGMGRLMQMELDASGSGCDAIVDRYLELILRELFAFAAANGTIDEGVLRAIPDRRLISALAAIHELPAQNWTVERLAATANMSRSLFARRFTQLIKDTPQNYLRRYRLREAVRLLQETNDSIETVAENVGYQSRSAFTKAFSRQMNMTPGRFRQSP